MATFQKDIAGWNHVLREPTGVVGKYMYSVAQRVTVMAKAQVGVDTGALRSSITYTVKTVPGGFLATITAHDNKALMHHQGTKAHIITPRKGQALRFKHHGKIVYARIVRHPGTKPNNFLTDPMRRVVG